MELAEGKILVTLKHSLKNTKKEETNEIEKTPTSNQKLD